MGQGKKTIPIRETPAYREAQHSERFQGWLRYQAAEMELEFVIGDVPELEGHLYTRDGLVIAERAILNLFEDERSAFRDNITLAMRFVYLIGETLRRVTEGEWVALPQQLPNEESLLPAIDAPYTHSFYDPVDILGIAMVRRSGAELSFTFDHALKAHQKWVGQGCSPRSS